MVLGAKKVILFYFLRECYIMSAVYINFRQFRHFEILGILLIGSLLIKISDKTLNPCQTRRT